MWLMQGSYFQDKSDKTQENCFDIIAIFHASLLIVNVKKIIDFEKLFFCTITLYTYNIFKKKFCGKNNILRTFHFANFSYPRLLFNLF